MHTQGSANVLRDLYRKDSQDKNIFLCTHKYLILCIILHKRKKQLCLVLTEIHNHMYLKEFAISIKNIWDILYTNCWICIYQLLIVGELHGICVWNFWDSPGANRFTANQMSSFFSANRINSSPQPDSSVANLGSLSIVLLGDKSRWLFTVFGSVLAFWRQSDVKACSRFMSFVSSGVWRKPSTVSRRSGGLVKFQQICNTLGLRKELHVHKPTPQNSVFRLNFIFYHIFDFYRACGSRKSI